MANKNNEAPKGGTFTRRLLIHIGCIIAATFIVGWITLTWLDVWTDHGDEVATPSVKGMPYDLARASLTAQGFGCVLIDSVYDSTRAPGTVTEQTPKEGAIVKEGREIYLTITAFNPKMVAVPKVTDVSERQARAMLAGVGLNNISTVTVPSDFKGLVAGVKINGQYVSAGMRVPVTSRVTLEVGSGPAEAEQDSLAVDFDDAEEISNF
ncbi:MAG: PASTA domain-containing protein [Bacteroides sp.]|nr:PASTA domain-containing protein [Bacteroides sp.]